MRAVPTPGRRGSRTADGARAVCVQSSEQVPVLQRRRRSEIGRPVNLKSVPAATRSGASERQYGQLRSENTAANRALTKA